MRRPCGLEADFPRRSARGKSRTLLLSLGLAALSFRPLSSLAASRILGGADPSPVLPASVEDGASKGRLLVASRQLQDPNFAETVVLMLDSGPSGAVGVVVNRPSKLELRSVLPNVKELTDRRDTVFLGGPVERFQLLLLVRAISPPKDSVRVFEDVFVTASLDALSRAAEGRGQEVRFRLFAGYTGWAPGQLEDEIARGDWLVVPGDVERVFAMVPERVWPELVERDGGRWVSLEEVSSGEVRERDCSPVAGTPTMMPPCEPDRSSSCVRWALPPSPSPRGPRPRAAGWAERRSPTNVRCSTSATPSTPIVRAPATP